MKSFFSITTAAVVCAVALASVPLSCYAEDHFSDWPEGTSPRFIGTRLTERFIGDLKRKPRDGVKREIRYQEIITWYGSLTFAKVSGKTEQTKELIARMDPMLKQDTHIIPPPDHVDRNVLGALAGEAFLQSGDQRFHDMAKHFADIQWEPTPEIVEKGDEGGKPQAGLSWKFDAEAKRNMEQGLSWQTRYWIDDMYMVTMAQGQMFLASQDRKYVDRAAKEMVAYLDKLQEPNGLFYHAPDVPFFWGRGNGWMAAGMTELLRILPQDNTDRPRILDGYRKMMAALKDTQTEDGMWRQLVDDPKSWPETSCTGMFTFALVTGVKEGWLEAKVYGPVARKGWIALAGFVHGNGAVCQVCDGTDKKNSHDYYMKRPRVLGDLHGQAAVLWSASALMRD
jgi:unsaturated rhamnogalacturonyl hydrolase